MFDFGIVLKQMRLGTGEFVLANLKTISKTILEDILPGALRECKLVDESNAQ